MLHIDYIAPTHFLLRYESRYVQFETPPAKWTKRHNKSITRKATHFLQPSVQFICTLVRPASSSSSSSVDVAMLHPTYVM